MFRLYHHPLDPFSRLVRLTLAEKTVAFEPVTEKPWERRAEFLALNPAAEVPVLVAVADGVRKVLCGATPVCEYLDETVAPASLLGAEAEGRAEVRRLVGWFNDKFWREVGQNLLGEKAMKRLAGGAAPDSAALRAGYANIQVHLDYIAWLTERRNWLAGAQLSLADLAAAAQLSGVDYLGDVPWDAHPAARDWYARVKSRPAFRSLLADQVAGLPPARHYANLDF